MEKGSIPLASGALLVRSLEGKLRRASETDRRLLQDVLSQAEATLAINRPVSDRLARAKEKLSALLDSPLASTAALLLGELDALTSPDAPGGKEELRQAELILATALAVASSRSARAA